METESQEFGAFLNHVGEFSFRDSDVGSKVCPVLAGDVGMDVV